MPASLSTFSAALILLLAAIADYLIGDPRGLLHPVQVMGWLIKRFVQSVIKLTTVAWQRRLAGVILGMGLIIGSGVVGWVIPEIFSRLNLLLGYVVSIILLASCFAGKSLAIAIKDVLKPLKDQDLVAARSNLSMYVGRDTDNLSKSEILRALLETVAENTVDGITAPLFYAILGLFLFNSPVPFALAYKASSTLDSMVGYRHEPYVDLGWFSAQLEDRLTWLPCRLTVLTLSLWSGRPHQVLSICRRDGVKDPSPNSGWSEAAYAAILQVQLGGKNTYKGLVQNKPLLGDPIELISPSKIERALNLSRSCFLIWLSTAVGIYLLLSFLSVYWVG